MTALWKRGFAPFRTLKMSTREMVENFPDNQILKAVQNGKISMPHDSAKKAIYDRAWWPWKIASRRSGCRVRRCKSSCHGLHLRRPQHLRKQRLKKRRLQILAQTEHGL